jgi:CBS domain containing-hemolysin-like protein
MPANSKGQKADMGPAEEDRERYNTVAGLHKSVSGHLPVTGRRIACTGWDFEIVDLDGGGSTRCW